MPCKLLFNSLLKDAKLCNYFHELKLVKKQRSVWLAALISIFTVNGERYCVKCGLAVSSLQLEEWQALVFCSHQQESIQLQREQCPLCVTQSI